MSGKTKSSKCCDCKKWNIFGKFTYSIVTNTELFFYKLGKNIAQQPIKTIALCWLFVFLSAFGFFRFRQEKNPLKLWVPPHTTFIRDSEWLLKTFQKGFVEEAIMITSEDVLSPKTINKLFEIHQKVGLLKSEHNITLKDVCFVIPKMEKSMLRMMKGKENETDLSMKIDPLLYCSLIESMRSECLTRSILQLWDFNATKIKSLTKNDIVNDINSYDKELNMFGRLKDFEELLGGIERNETNHIVRATAIQNVWFLNVNFSAIDMDKAGNIAGTGEWISEEGLEWENSFLDMVGNIAKNDSHFYFMAGRSFGDISKQAMFQDMDKLVLGCFIMVIYVQFVISKFNWFEVRVLLGSVGLLAIGMGYVVSVGLCSLVGIYYGPVHMSLPFLLMGLGVDDMLVIMTCWDELSEEEHRLPLPERVGLMLKHAGVSITITSFTDVIAFIIGSSTILPCLESFCIYAAVGVFMIFAFSITFFTACFVLDQKRVEMKRNGIIPCIKHENYKPSAWSQSKMTGRVFYWVYKNIIFTTPGKITVVLIALVCAGFGIQGTLKLEQRFDLKWFLPEGSHLANFVNTKYHYYPDFGFPAGLYMGKLNYTQEIGKIKGAVDKLENYTDVLMNLNTWVGPFRKFVMINFHQDIYIEDLDEERFNLFLSKFLHSPRYAKYQANFVFEKDLECGVAAPKIIMSTLDFDLKRFDEPEDQIAAMHKIRDVAETMNLTSGDKFVTAWSKFFSTWITDELIDVEVSRNLQLALLCVMGCTILLIADLQTCFWIFICVLITMVNVCGFMQRWGLTIDLVSCIGLELAIGLCVDYATHIGHTFLTIRDGSREERALKTVSSIGSAVLFGGLSTFIGVFMMSQSDAYTFQSFFKIFLLVIVFGLYHGIVLFPVILSWIGPNPYEKAKIKPIPQSDIFEDNSQIKELQPMNEKC